LSNTYGVIAVGAQVWASAGKAALAPQASIKVDKRSFMLPLSGKGLGTGFLPATGSDEQADSGLAMSNSSIQCRDDLRWPVNTADRRI
jgi:hypothetical protein